MSRSSSSPADAAMPTSTTFAPPGVSTMLAGFTSRWTRPSAWAAARPVLQMLADALVVGQLAALVPGERVPRSGG